MAPAELNAAAAFADGSRMLAMRPWSPTCEHEDFYEAMAASVDATLGVWRGDAVGEREGPLSCGVEARHGHLYGWGGALRED